MESDKTVDHCVFVPIPNATPLLWIGRRKNENKRQNRRRGANERRAKTNEWMEGSRYHLRDTSDARAERLPAGAPEPGVGGGKLCYFNLLSMQLHTRITRHFPFLRVTTISAARQTKNHCVLLDALWWSIKQLDPCF